MLMRHLLTGGQPLAFVRWAFTRVCESRVKTALKFDFKLHIGDEIESSGLVSVGVRRRLSMAVVEE